MGAFINGLLLSAVLFIGLLASISLMGQARFAQLTRPPTHGYMAEVMRLKTKAAQKIIKPKIIVVSGSGGIYGISCAVVTTKTNIPCINAGLPIEAGLPGILQFAQTVAKPGDTLLLPVEYALYYLPKFTGVAENSEKRITLIDRMLNSDFQRLFRVDLTYTLFSLVENTLAAAGYKSYNLDDIFTPLGDRKGHSKTAGQPYVEKIAKEPIYELKYSGVMTEGFVYHMGQFLAWAQKNNIKVIATLQPSYNDWAIPQAWLKDIAAFYEKNGTVFVRPKGLYQYPRSDFYDGVPHLNEEMQKVHSQKVASDIAPFLPPSKP